MNKEMRFKEAETVAMVGIIANVGLVIIKGITGFISGSRGLIADAVHSATDVAGSLAVYVGLKAAKQPPDEDHPYGHGKAESIAAIIVSVLLILVGFEILQSSIKLFFEDIKPPKTLALYIIIFSMIAKEVLFRYTISIGKKLNSEALIINAYDHRSDVYSLIAVLFGVIGSIIGGKIGIPWLVYLDPVAGLVVSLLIIKMAWSLGKESIHNTLDHVLPENETEEMKKLVFPIEGIKNITQLFARQHGHYVIVDIKISVDPYITVEAGHKIGKQVKRTLLTLPNVENVFVHVNPYSPEESSK